jgi:low affinity Fe/Cu permease
MECTDEGNHVMTRSTPRRRAVTARAEANPSEANPSEANPSEANPSEANPSEANPSEAPESLFLRIADWVSEAMGRPTNILIWLLLVIIWVAIFAFGNQHIASGSWLPSWFTSQGFNFPLNLVTTVAELFIGFLVAAAANRSERRLEETLAKLGEAEDRAWAMEEQLVALLTTNTELTQEIKADTALLHEIHRHVSALAPADPRDEPPPAAP